MPTFEHNTEKRTCVKPVFALHVIAKFIWQIPLAFYNNIWRVLNLPNKFGNYVQRK